MKTMTLSSALYQFQIVFKYPYTVDMGVERKKKKKRGGERNRERKKKVQICIWIHLNKHYILQIFAEIVFSYDRKQKYKHVKGYLSALNSNKQIIFTKLSFR